MTDDDDPGPVPKGLDDTGPLGPPEQIKKLRTSLVKYLCSLRAPIHIAEELAQDTLKVLVQKILEDPGMFAERKLVPYAIRTANNKMLDYWGRKSTKNEKDRLPEVGSAAEPFVDPEEEIRFSRLRAVVDELESPCRELIHMRYFDGYTSRQALERFVGPGGWKFKTVNALDLRRSHCLETLRGIWREIEPFEKRPK
jgi:DNA-directed RNA polymerase specialized sigma24 family protein